jgi:hypothetical protein
VVANGSGAISSATLPVAIFMTLTAAPIRSDGRVSPSLGHVRDYSAAAGVLSVPSSTLDCRMTAILP